MAQQPVQDPTNALLSEFGTRLTEVESRQKLLKDRLLLIGENLVEMREEQVSENFEIKKKLKDLESEIKELKQLNRRIISDLGNFARKSHLEILERQWEMFKPLEFARIKDIDKMLKGVKR